MRVDGDLLDVLKRLGDQAIHADKDEADLDLKAWSEHDALLLSQVKAAFKWLLHEAYEVDLKRAQMKQGLKAALQPKPDGRPPRVYRREPGPREAAARPARRADCLHSQEGDVLTVITTHGVTSRKTPLVMIWPKANAGGSWSGATRSTVMAPWRGPNTPGATFTTPENAAGSQIAPTPFGPYP